MVLAALAPVAAVVVTVALVRWREVSPLALAGLAGIGHRVVHGGETFQAPTLIDDQVGRVLDALNTAIYKRFIEHGIEIPYSKHDLYIKELPQRG